MTNVSMIDVSSDGLTLTFHGRGLGDGIIDPDLTFEGPSGPFTFHILSVNDRMLVIDQINPPIVVGKYVVKFRGREIGARDVIDPLMELSGIYFFNPVKVGQYDSYYTYIGKIPDPTIRTAFIGA